ncbi:hypothetical protein JX266_008128 [Neoarthrinium moseri]|nr:hypothetical protein JX266_008128 [Neoarthrinium moseri]
MDFIRQRRVRARANNIDARLENILSNLRDEDLAEDVAAFHRCYLPKVDYGRLLGAAKVAKNPKTYEDISRAQAPYKPGLVKLSGEEQEALIREQDSAMPEAGMFIVILTVSLAAFLQGQVQSSINSASLYEDLFDISGINATIRAHNGTTLTHTPRVEASDWILGVMNATPFLSAACFGCWVALPLSDRFGRKGSMQVAAILVLITSAILGGVPAMSGGLKRWNITIILRMFNGFGMGIKAVNTPMLASECAVGYWRGTSVMAWQLWVACGIMVGFASNALFARISNYQTQLTLILGAPLLPALILCVVSLACPESPRYYLRRRDYNPAKAYNILKGLRRSELIAMRDIYVLHKSVQEEFEAAEHGNPSELQHSSVFMGFKDFSSQVIELFQKPRLRNALISTSIVSLAQQLCGIKILAFYSGTLFSNLSGDQQTSLAYSIGFGAVNFIFGLAAIKYIDTIGRRKWLITTLPPMAVLLVASSASSKWALGGGEDDHTASILVAIFLYIHAALYSPGLGPVPFTLAAESFPLTHREAGCAFAISINLFFAGLLSLFFPIVLSKISYPGTLGLFAGMSVLAFILVFLFVEETKQKSLEDLDFVFGVPKTQFVRFQVFKYLPWIFQQYLPWYFNDYLPYLIRLRFLRRKATDQKGDLEARVQTEKSMIFWQRKPDEPMLYHQDLPTCREPLDPDDPCY